MVKILGVILLILGVISIANAFTKIPDAEFSYLLGYFAPSVLLAVAGALLIILDRKRKK